jgi:GNAT superfamily N-acetyltransferase
MTQVDVRALTSEDWPAYREVRLAMLEDAPWAFGTTLAKALTLDEAGWRQRLTDNRTFLATVVGQAAGSATFSDTFVDDPEDAYLVGMWVAPRHRGSGAAGVLVQAVLDHARAVGKRRVLLHVVDTNQPARRLYERAAFVPTGLTEPYPHHPGVVEVQMERLL